MNKKVLYLIILTISLLMLHGLFSLIKTEKVISFTKDNYNQLVNDSYDSYEFLYFPEGKTHKYKTIEDFYNNFDVTSYKVIACNKITSNLYQVNIKIDVIYNKTNNITDTITRYVFFDENDDLKLALNHNHLPDYITQNLHFKTKK